MSNLTQEEYPNQLLGLDAIQDTNAGAANKFSLPVKLATVSGATGAILNSGAGVPAVGGNVGDLYINVSGGDATYFYRCTVAGAAGVATWAAITGA